MKLKNHALVKINTANGVQLARIFAVNGDTFAAELPDGSTGYYTAADLITLPRKRVRINGLDTMEWPEIYRP